MGLSRLKGLLAVASTALLAPNVLAAPLSSRLLPLVPPGAAIVAGFENHGRFSAHGRLLLTTRNNRLDLEDFQSLAGVDSKRALDEVIQVAAATQAGLLSEHMLLVAGRFDRERIFRSIEEAGAKGVSFLGQKILLIRPFTRERDDMIDTRWLVIVENRIAILGTPSLVQLALRRYADHAVPDSVLEERLSLMRPDVNSWNVLARSQKKETHIDFSLPHSAWAQLQRDADILMVGARFGHKIRVDFSIHADADHGSDFFVRKAEVFTDALGQPGTKPAKPMERRLRDFAMESNRVKGSVEMSARQFEAWCEQLYVERVSGRTGTSSGN